MKGFALHINGSTFSEEELINSSGYNTPILSFCKSWLKNAPFYSVHTSGSTGTPKEIQLSRNQFLKSVALTQKTFDLTSGDTCLLNLSTEHIAGKLMLIRAIEIGMEVTSLTPSSNPLLNLDKSFDFYAFVPLQLRAILKETPEKIQLLNSAKAIIIGGAKISLELEELLQKIKAPVYATYGMTETVTHIAIQRLNGEHKAKYFTPLPGIQLQVDERGCLQIKGEVTNNQLITTNDLVRLHGDDFELLGRIDNIINTGGVKVSAEKIEQEIEQYFLKKGISNRFFVDSLPDAQLGEQVILFIENDFKEENELQLFSYLSKKLSAYEIPKQIKRLILFQETVSGKIDRKTSIKTL